MRVTAAAPVGDLRQTADEVEHALRQEIGLYFPRSVDSVHGGFHANYRNDWTPGPADDRHVVFQSRLTWVASEVARRRPALAPQFVPYADHGLNYLRDTLWDPANGGFFWTLDEQGQIDPTRPLRKQTYGISFALYALAANVERSRDSATLELAKKTFLWLDQHGHDAVNGGYFESFDRAGTPVGTTSRPSVDSISTAVGAKSMNTHIHLLESFTALYRVWPDPLLKQRLTELRNVVRDRIACDGGYLNMYFARDWHPVTDRDSYGHDVETSYLLIEADEALDGFACPATLRVAKMMVDHALSVAWDSREGGLFDEGDAAHPLRLVKTWWVQAEMLNTLLLMHERFDGSGDRYLIPFFKQWEFIRDRQIDSVHGGWFEELDRDGNPTPNRNKSQDWKACYHTSRALMDTADRLRHLDDVQASEKASTVPQTILSPLGVKRALIFDDEFDGAVAADGTRGIDPEKWRTTFWQGKRTLSANGEAQDYLDIDDAAVTKLPPRSRINPFRFNNGILSISTTEVPRGLWPDYGMSDHHHDASGLLISDGHCNFQYGYVVGRFKLPAARGAWPAFWMLGDDPSLGDTRQAHAWPPEVDIFEFFGHVPDRHSGSLHARDGESPLFSFASHWVGEDLSKDFHTWGFEWNEHQAVWTFDGSIWARSDIPPSFHRKMYLLINLAVGGNWYASQLRDRGVSVQPWEVDAASMPWVMSCDYVRVYQ